MGPTIFIFTRISDHLSAWDGWSMEVKLFYFTGTGSSPARISTQTVRIIIIFSHNIKRSVVSLFFFFLSHPAHYHCRCTHVNGSLGPKTRLDKHHITAQKSLDSGPDIGIKKTPPPQEWHLLLVLDTPDWTHLSILGLRRYASFLHIWLLDRKSRLRWNQPENSAPVLLS